MTDAQLWTLAPMLTVALVVILALILYRYVARLFGIVIVPEDSVGIVNKKYVVVGQNRTLPAGAIIALNGEAAVRRRVPVSRRFARRRRHDEHRATRKVLLRSGAAATEVEVLELSPRVWVGKKFSVEAHGPGTYLDVRNVAPTTADRTELLELVRQLTK